MRLRAANQRVLVLHLVLLCLGPVACEHECETCEDYEPAAPQDLEAERFKSGIHLTWRDVSNNEDYFIIERAALSSARLRHEVALELSATPEPTETLEFGHHFFELVRLPANTEDYLDTKVSSGMVYYYRVKAVNEAGTSTSKELAVTVP